VPEYESTEQARTKLDDGTWRVSVRVKNKGTGRMPLEICAARGERFPTDDSKPATARRRGGVQAAETAKVYRDARASVVLGAGDSELVTLDLRLRARARAGRPRRARAATRARGGEEGVLTSTR
jgi:hypothetical protein